MNRFAQLKVTADEGNLQEKIDEVVSRLVKEGEVISDVSVYPVKQYNYWDAAAAGPIEVVIYLVTIYVYKPELPGGDLETAQQIVEALDFYIARQSLDEDAYASIERWRDEVKWMIEESGEPFARAN